MNTCKNMVERRERLKKHITLFGPKYIRKFTVLNLIRIWELNKIRFQSYVEYMVYPSDLCRVTTTENLGICTLHRSTRPRSGSRDTLRRCGRGTRPYWTWLPTTRGSSNPTEARSLSPNVN